MSGISSSNNNSMKSEKLLLQGSYTTMLQFKIKVILLFNQTSSKKNTQILENFIPFNFQWFNTCRDSMFENAYFNAFKN